MLPEAFCARMQDQLGTEYPAFLESLSRPRAVALRFRPGLVRPLPFLGAGVPWEPLGYYFEPTARPGLHPYHEAGVYYLQEASAMAPAALLSPQPGERICDLCAAPGGKSTQISGRMGGTGFLLSNEIHPKRAAILSRNMERMGVANALVTNESPQRLAQRLPDFFDRVLVDAPCSGEGMFRKEEAALTDWSPETVAMCARRQAEILESAAAMVRPGGLLVYSTCTFAPQENEAQVAAFLARHGDFSLEGASVPGITAQEPGIYRLWPHKVLGEGQFAAVLRRAGRSAPASAPAAQVSVPDPAWQSFASEMGIHLPEGKPLTFGSALYWVPLEMPALAGLKVLRPGLSLGEVRKGRFLPSHALALWLDNCANTQDYPAQSQETAAYLHGDTVPSERKGWCLVTVDGFSLGWGKGDGAVLKNHYPKGLRK